MINRFKNLGKPCIGPVPGIACELASLVLNRGANARRCRECSCVRYRLQSNASQRKTRARKRAEKGQSVPTKPNKLGGGLGNYLAGEQRREPIKRCPVCLGTAHMREPGRVDDWGKPVCLPGMARCRVCWEPWAPLPEVHAQAVLGSSAAMAARSGAPW